MMVVEQCHLSILEVYDLPICECLYYACYYIDKKKAEEAEFKKQQMRYKNK